MYKLFEEIYNNGRTICTVHKDPHTGRNIARTVHDGRELIKFNKNAQNEYGKTTHFFNSNVRDGDRLIAKIPLITQKTHPEIWKDDQALMKYLDEHPECKTMPVGWTRTTKGRMKNVGGAKELIIGAK